MTKFDCESILYVVLFVVAVIGVAMMTAGLIMFNNGPPACI